MPHVTTFPAATVLAANGEYGSLCTRLERGNDLPRALAVCVLNKVPQEDATVVRETFDHHLGSLAKGEQKNAK